MYICVLNWRVCITIDVSSNANMYFESGRTMMKLTKFYATNNAPYAFISMIIDRRA